MFRDFMTETFIDCVGWVEDDGTIVYEGRRFDPERGFADMVVYARQQACAGHGAMMWNNLKQKEIAGHDVVEFLNATFARSGTRAPDPGCILALLQQKPVSR